MWQVSSKSRSQRVPSWLLGYAEALVKDTTLGGGIWWGRSMSPHPWGAHRMGGGVEGPWQMSDISRYWDIPRNCKNTDLDSLSCPLVTWGVSQSLSGPHLHHMWLQWSLSPSSTTYPLFSISTATTWVQLTNLFADLHHPLLPSLTYLDNWVRG